MSILDQGALFESLCSAGRTPQNSLIESIIANEHQYKPLLVRFFKQILEVELNILNIGDPKRYTGILIGRILIQLNAIEAIPIIGELYRKTWGEDVTVDGLDRDPAAFGERAIPIFGSLVQMNTLNKWHNGKASAITILTDIALWNEAAKGEVQRILRAELPSLNANGGISAPKDEMWGDIALALGKLQDKPSYKTILAMIRQGVVDSNTLTRERYEKFYSGEQKPRKSEPFDIFAKYKALDNFEEMMFSMIDSKDVHQPDHSQDLVSRAKSVDNKAIRVKAPVGRNDPCTCGSGKKYKNCCGKNLR